MKKILNGAVLALAIAVAMAGCSSADKKEDAEGAGEAGAPVAEAGTGEAGVATAGAAPGGAWTGSPLDNPDSILYTKVIYFDYDSSQINMEYRDLLRAHADYLASNPSAAVVIEGHGDERGSREYNIALGERRALAVKRYLEAEGIPSSQMSVVSYGEERPADYGHSERAWSMNRRAVLVY